MSHSRWLPLLAIMLTSPWAQSAALDGQLQKRVRDATFEVVVPKPTEDAVKYERPPPFELLPFTERNDKHWPLGTAFAIADDTYVTAAHVLAVALGGQGGLPMLRDSRGKTYPISRVLKFSGHQDFVVFTADLRAPVTLVTRPAPQVDEPVFAVGNALGEGVVIRDGLLTSLTPEHQDGRWKWLRYSAATSPGNSGGPLLNATGEVIGVVIGKSESENLNYALPIEHVLDAANVARMEQRFPLRVPMLRDGIVARTDITIPLPLPLAEFATRWTAEQMRGYRAERARLLVEKASELPPRGKADDLLNSVEWAACPLLVVQDKERDWQPFGDSRETLDVSNGGKVCTRNHGGIGLFSLDRGKATDPAFYTDRRRAMDLLLEGFKLTRSFGEESVALTSLGAPASDVEHRDQHGRRWRVTTFTLPYMDSHLVLLLLPTPDGYAGMLTLAPRSLLEFMTDQLLFASDYFYLSYNGTLPQWQVFLARPDLPAALAGIKISRDAQGLHYRSKRVDFDVPPALLKVDDTSTVQLRMSYSLAGNSLVWDVGAIYVSDEGQDERFFSLARQPKPPEGARKKLNDRWAEMLDSRGDFAPGRGHDSDYKKYWRRAAISADYKPGATVDRNATLLYAITSSIEAARLPRDIDDMHDLLLENVRVKER
jgi:serine protease Do